VASAADGLNAASAAGVPARSGRRTALIAAAVVVVLGGGVAAYAMRGPHTGAAAVPQGTALPGTQAAVQSPPRDPKGAVPTGRDTTASQASTPDTKQPAGGVRPHERASAKAPAPGPNSNASVSSILDGIEPLVDETSTRATGQEAMRQLTLIAPRLATDDDRLHAQILRAQAAFALDRLAEGCELLKQAQSAAVGSPRSSRIIFLLSSC
jgi:hypothetical protein